MTRLYKDHRSPRGLARLLGHDHLAAMVLSKIVAWSKVAKKKEFGVTKTDKEWCRDLEVTPKQFRRVKEFLVKFGLIEKFRAPWGKLPNALFLKPTPLAERLLNTPPFWAPSSRPKRQVVVNIGPNGQEQYSLYSPDGPFLYPIKTIPNKNKSNKELTGDHAHAWSQFPPEELRKLVLQEEVSERRVIEIDTVPRLIAHWDNKYCEAMETEMSPPWLPGHLSIVERLINEEIEEYLETALKSDAEDEAWAKEQGEDKDGSVEQYIFEEKQVSDPDAFRSEIREELETEICRRLAVTISWTVQNWFDFTDWLKKVVDTKDVPEFPEVEFLFYYSALAEVWSSNNHYYTYSDEEYVKDIMYRGKDNLEKDESEYHEVAAKYHHNYVKQPWTLEQYIPVIMGAGMGIAIMAARYWIKWRELEGDKDGIKAFSTDAMIEELDDFATWAVKLCVKNGITENEATHGKEIVFHD